MQERAHLIGGRVDIAGVKGAGTTLYVRVPVARAERGSKMMRKVLIVDDHEVVRDGVKRLLDEQPGDIYCGEAGTPDEAVRMALADDWDAVVLDLSFAGKSGLEVLKELKQIAPVFPCWCSPCIPRSNTRAARLKPEPLDLSPKTARGRNSSRPSKGDGGREVLEPRAGRETDRGSGARHGSPAG